MREKLIELLNDCQAKGFWSYGRDCKTGEHGGHEMTADDIADYLVENIKWQTNADRIRAMSDEELAEFLCGVFDEDECSGKYICGVTIADYDQFNIAEWLKQPAEGE